MTWIFPKYGRVVPGLEFPPPDKTPVTNSNNACVGGSFGTPRFSLTYCSNAISQAVSLPIRWNTAVPLAWIARHLKDGRVLFGWKSGICINRRRLARTARLAAPVSPRERRFDIFG